VVVSQQTSTNTSRPLTPAHSLSSTGGGNGQKSATARLKKQAKEAAAGKGGGGKEGMSARSGDGYADALAAKQAERAVVKAAREAKKK